MISKVQVYMFLHIALITSTAGNKTGLFLSPFLIFTSRFLISAETFQNDYVADCSTALRTATEKNEMSGYTTVPVGPNWYGLVGQRAGLTSIEVTRSVATEHIRNKCSLLKSRSVLIAVIVNAN